MSWSHTTLSQKYCRQLVLCWLCSGCSENMTRCAGSKHEATSSWCSVIMIGNSCPAILWTVKQESFDTHVRRKHCRLEGDAQNVSIFSRWQRQEQSSFWPGHFIFHEKLMPKTLGSPHTTKHTIVLGHYMRKMFCPVDVSRTSRKNSQTKAVRKQLYLYVCMYHP